MAKARGHSNFKNLCEIDAAAIRKFVVKCYEKSLSQSLHESIITSQLAFYTHHGKVWKLRKDLIDYATKDHNWVHPDFMFPVLSLEWHVDFATIVNSNEGVVVKNYRAMLVKDLNVRCDWEIKHVLMCLTNPKIKMSTKINIRDATQCNLLNKVASCKSDNSI